MSRAPTKQVKLPGNLLQVSTLIVPLYWEQTTWLELQEAEMRARVSL